MIARLPRRLALVAAAAATVPVLAGALDRDEDDALLELSVQLRANHARELDAVRRLMAAETARDARATEAAVAASDDAFDTRAGLMRRMAAIPAHGLAGLAAKAALVCRALDQSGTEADRLLAESLMADVARLAPAAMA